MADMLKVTAVEGRMLPVEGGPPGRFVGYELLTDERTPSDHDVPVSKTVLGPTVATRRYATFGDAVEVPNTRYYRAAVGRGDIKIVETEEER